MTPQQKRHRLNLMLLAAKKRQAAGPPAEVYTDVPFDPSQHGMDPTLPPSLQRSPYEDMGLEEDIRQRLINFENSESIRRGRLEGLGYQVLQPEQEAARLAQLSPEQRYYEQLARLGARRPRQ